MGIVIFFKLDAFYASNISINDFVLSALVEPWLQCPAADTKVHVRAQPGRSYFDEGETVEALNCVMSVTVEEHQVVEITGALHYDVS